MITGPTLEYLRRGIPEYASPAARPQSFVILARRPEAVYCSQIEPGPDDLTPVAGAFPAPIVAEGGDHGQAAPALGAGVRLARFQVGHSMSGGRGLGHWCGGRAPAIPWMNRGISFSMSFPP